jgi:NAD(P)-dependent dehydrogenase (short-subunit alcohol dehydrogenase family)
VADVSVDNDVKTLFELAESDRPVDGVVHAAAILGPIGTVVDIEPSDWLQAIQVDLYGTFLVTRRACQSMIMAGRAGSIVLLSGCGAATPFPRYTAYASSKAGVARFAETAALEMAAHGIRVNCLAPGFVATRLHQQTLDAGERAGTYGERTANLLTTGGVPPTVAARAAAFLLSDRAKDITGRFVAAPYDDWEQWPAHASELQDSDLFTLRRIVPRDRGRDWQ